MLTNLIAIMILIESAGNPYAVGAAGELGVLQQTPAFLEQVNRWYAIPPELKFRWPEDALDPSMARIATEMFLTHKASGPTVEIKVRRFNGGPRGEKKRATRKYWERVRRELRRGATT